MRDSVFLVSFSVDPENDGVTSIVCLAEIIETVAATDGDPFDRVYDKAGPNTQGPTPFGEPAGYFRPKDYPNPWCTNFLDFFDLVNADRPRSPGVGNAK